jgi:hypothetical protein
MKSYNNINYYILLKLYVKQLFGFLKHVIQFSRIFKLNFIIKWRF